MSDVNQVEDAEIISEESVKEVKEKEAQASFDDRVAYLKDLLENNPNALYELRIQRIEAFIGKLIAEQTARLNPEYFAKLEAKEDVAGMNLTVTEAIVEWDSAGRVINQAYTDLEKDEESGLGEESE